MREFAELSAAAARTVLVFLVFFSLLFSSDCSSKTPKPVTKVTVQLEEPGKTHHVGPESITLKLRDAQGEIIAGAQVELEGNMTHAGMAPIFGQAIEVAPGMYRAMMQFSMAGDWVITLRARLSDGQQVEQQFEVKVVGS